MKSQVSSILWEEMDAVWQAMHGILSQEAGSGAEKVAMVKTVFGNFLDSLDTAMVALKCDCLESKQEAVAKSQEEPAPDTEPEASAETPAGESIIGPEELSVTQSAPLEQEKIAEQATLNAVEAMKAHLAETLKPLTEGLADVQAEVAKMQKAPVAVVSDRTDDGIVAAKKSQQHENVFAGVFGHLR